MTRNIYTSISRAYCNHMFSFAGSVEVRMNELAELNALVARGEEDAVVTHIQTKQLTPDSCKHLPSWSDPVSVAAVNGRTKILNILLSMGFLPHKDRHPLHYACTMGHMDVVKCLIEDHRVEIMIPDCKGQTPLYMAVFNDNYDIMKYLIERGADVNECGPMPLIVIAVIHYKPDLCKYLIEQGANVDVHDVYGRSPLAAAARSGSKDIASLLINAGADVNIKGREGTPFLSASKAGRLSMMAVLQSKGADVNICDIDGDTALHLAASEGHYTVVRYLIVDLCVILDTINHHNKSAFQIALENMDVDMMYLFHQAGYNTAKELSGYFHFEIESPAKEVLFRCISDLTNIPHTLQDLCCLAVRKCLRTNVQTLTEELPLPQTVKEHVLLNHIPRRRRITHIFK